jgi:hypothetical protein
MWNDWIKRAPKKILKLRFKCKRPTGWHRKKQFSQGSRKITGKMEHNWQQIKKKGNGTQGSWLKFTDQHIF